MNIQGKIVSEIWRDIPGYEGLYQVSSEGLVRSVKREKLLRLQLNNSGYLRTNLSKQGKCKYVFAHRLVALAFLGAPEKGIDVNHIDGNKLNNRLSNLEYVTRSQNMKHARSMGLHNNYADGHYNAVLTSEDALYLQIVYSQTGLRGNDLAAHFGVSARTINDVLDGKTWKSIDLDSYYRGKVAK